MRFLELLNVVPFSPLALVLAYIADLLAGDPERFPHPVRWIGKLITALEGRLYRRSTPARERLAGALLALAVVVVTYGVTLAVLYLCYLVSIWALFLASALVVWWGLSVRSLGSEAASVASALSAGLDGARARLARIVGRDTGALSEEGVAKAAVETVAENASDGVVAPLFYLIIGGPALMMAYKAVNTLDSMVGYKNDRYAHFGWFSARMDDAANYIPARLTGALLVTSAFVLGYNWRRSAAVLLRDGKKHPSPNSGVPEAAMAGALGLKLGGGSFYNGVFHEKPSIGDGGAAADAASIAASVKVMRAAAFLMVVGALFFRTLAIFVL